jgi:hypothetical protein
MLDTHHLTYVLAKATTKERLGRYRFSCERLGAGAASVRW